MDKEQYKYDVFLSFSSKDSKFVDPICEKLEKSGFKVFYSKKSLKRYLGLPFGSVIGNALGQSRNFVLICTPNASESKWVKREYEVFYNRVFMKSKKADRRLIILKGEGYTDSLESKFDVWFQDLQKADSIDDVIEALVDNSDDGFETPPEPVRVRPEDQSNTPGINKKARRQKFIKRLSLFTLFAAAIIFIFIFLINLASVSNELYVSNLSFFDRSNQSLMSNKALKIAFDEAVENGMNMAREVNNQGLNFRMPNSRENTEKLAHILFDPDITNKKKFVRIINEMMIPHNADVILTGQYIEKSPGSLITVRPMVIIRDTRKVISKNFQFLRSELFVENPKTHEKIICDDAYTRIKRSARKLLSQFGLENLCVESLSFIDAIKISSMANQKEAELLYRALLRGVCEAKNKRLLMINVNNHTIANTDANINNLINIKFNPDLTGGEKIGLIIKKLMRQNNVDVIVSGDYIDNTGISTITIRPFVIIRDIKAIYYRNLQFERPGFFCAPVPDRTTILSDKVYGAITQAVQGLLEQL